MNRVHSSLIVLTMWTALLFLTGCKADAGKTDVSLSAHASTEQSLSAAASRPEPAPAPVTPSLAASQPGDAAASPTRPPVLVCFGDSITAGYGLDPGESYPVDLQHDLDASGYHYRVVNMGISGETTKDGLLRVPRVLALRPDIVVVEFGGNDGLRGLPIPDTQRNLATIVRALRQGGARVLLAGITLPPQYGPDYVQQFDAMYPAVAHQTAVPLLPFIGKGVYDVPGDIQDDGIHPTAEGAKVVARNIAGSLQPMLHR